MKSLEPVESVLEASELLVSELLAFELSLEVALEPSEEAEVGDDDDAPPAAAPPFAFFPFFFLGFSMKSLEPAEPSLEEAELGVAEDAADEPAAPDEDDDESLAPPAAAAAFFAFFFLGFSMNNLELGAALAPELAPELAVELLASWAAPAGPAAAAPAAAFFAFFFLGFSMNNLELGAALAPELASWADPAGPPAAAAPFFSFFAFFGFPNSRKTGVVNCSLLILFPLIVTELLSVLVFVAAVPLSTQSESEMITSNKQILIIKGIVVSVSFRSSGSAFDTE